MQKTFYTEYDIEDLVRRGVHSIELCDDVVLTELAYEKAERLGMKLVHEHEKPPSAPVRPYISKETYTGPKSEMQSPTIEEDLNKRIKDAVIARLGNQVDSTLLDTIIQRVLTNVGLE